jgi:hypothetical protein
MPTSNPRVNVTLSPSLDSLVIRLAGLQGVSKSQVLRELLEAAEPALQRATALMEAASRSKGDVLNGLARSLERGQDKVEAQLAAHLASLDASTADLVTQAQAVRGRRPAIGAAGVQGASPTAARGRSNPPASNRGVKSVGKAPAGVRRRS